MSDRNFCRKRLVMALDQYPVFAEDDSPTSDLRLSFGQKLLDPDKDEREEDVKAVNVVVWYGVHGKREQILTMQGQGELTCDDDRYDECLEACNQWNFGDHLATAVVLQRDGGCRFVLRRCLDLSAGLSDDLLASFIEGFQTDCGRFLHDVRDSMELDD